MERQPIPDAAARTPHRESPKSRSVTTQQSAMAEASAACIAGSTPSLKAATEDGSVCILCGGCVDVCPENCLELVSLDRIEFTPETVRPSALTRNVRRRTG